MGGEEGEKRLDELNVLWSSVEAAVTSSAKAEELPYDPEAVRAAMHAAAARIAEENRSESPRWAAWAARRTYVSAKMAQLALDELRRDKPSD